MFPLKRVALLLVVMVLSVPALAGARPSAPSPEGGLGTPGVAEIGSSLPPPGDDPPAPDRPMYAQALSATTRQTRASITFRMPT